MKRLPIVAVVLLVVTAAMSAFAAGVVVGDRDSRASMMDAAMIGPGMGGVDVRGGEAAYLAAMVAHHEDAVEAAGELARSGRPEMRAFGEAIVGTQTAQIEQMEEWLADWHPEEPLDVGYQPMMRDLSRLSGDRLDRVFLQDMVGHHMVAVMMSMRLLASGPDHEDVADLARDIRDEQHAEIIQMRRWLATWPMDRS